MAAGEKFNGIPGESAIATARAKRKEAEQLVAEAGLHEKGAAGERAVAAVLDGLPDGYVALHDLDVPGSLANVDHLVIGPSGVFVVDAKNWAKVSAGKDTWWSGQTSIDPACSTVEWLARQMCGHLDVPVTPIMCFTGSSLPEPRREIGGVMVCSTTNVREIIESHSAVLSAAAADAAEARARTLIRCKDHPTPIVEAATSTRRTLDAFEPLGMDPNRGRRRLSKAGFGLLTMAAVLGLFGLAVKLLPSFISGFSDSMTNAATSITASQTTVAPSVAPTTPPSPVVTASATTEPSATLPGASFLPPTVAFTCVPETGWTASAEPTEFVTDQEGFHLWYQFDSAVEWTYWGRFQSGIASTIPVGALRSGAPFVLKAGRDSFLSPPEGAGVTFEVPVETC